jgi:DNA polymerase-3 subunit delta
MKPVSVHDYLWDAAKYPPQAICVVFGDDSFLRSNAVRHIKDQVLAKEDAEFALSKFDGNDKNVGFRDVLKELRTAAMFGGDRRLICIDEADSFVTKYRTEFENYAAKPSQQAVLILQLKTFPATTKLYKQLTESGLLIEAKTLSEKEMPQWIARWSKHHYKTVCDLDAAEMIVQRIGIEHGLLDQELAKLSLMVDEKKKITAELVEQAVGSWRSRTAFEMLDLALAGQTAAAIRQLDTLVLAGEDPVGILGQITSTLRKFAMTTELILDAERRKTKTTLHSALEKAGVKKGFILNKAEGQLIKLGRNRGAKLLNWLLQLDLDLKGDSKSDKRILLERFIVNISSEKLRELPK